MTSQKKIRLALRWTPNWKLAEDYMGMIWKTRENERDWWSTSNAKTHSIVMFFIALITTQQKSPRTNNRKWCTFKTGLKKNKNLLHAAQGETPKWVPKWYLEKWPCDSGTHRLKHHPSIKRSYEMRLCMYLCIHRCMHRCMHEMYAWMHECMKVCMHGC